LKQETANAMGVQLGGETSSRANGAVGGQMTKKLVAQAEQQMSSQQQQS
jgi:small acid-soluble spore protein A (major alpha-type SASP)